MLLTALKYIVTHLYTFVHTSKLAKPLVEVGGLVLAACIGIGIYHHFRPVETVTQLEPNVKVVTVDKPVLTEKVITKLLTDPKDKALIDSLLAENRNDKLSITQLSQTLSDLQQKGSGVVTEVPPAKPGDPISYHFKDWHLDFSTDTKTATYVLNQKFEVLSSTGTDATGKATSLFKVYEIGANGERIPLKNVSTTDIVANPNSAHWMIHPNVQAGVGIVYDPTAGATPGAIIGYQWLKRGLSKASEDVSIAVGTPVVFFATKVQSFGVMPVSVNIGRKIPGFTNFWVSPFVGLGSRVGLVLSATF